MAKCKNCGKSAGVFSDMCAECKLKIDEEELLRLQHATEESIHKLEAEKLAAQKGILDKVTTRVESGQYAFMFESLFVQVDSILLGQNVCDSFFIGALRKAGFSGWEVVAVVPKTLGYGLTNSSFGSTSGDTWGGGMGGNVVGVYFILRKQITIEDLGTEALSNYIGSHLFELVD